ncbi:MAG: alanine--tRNA ligase, partial [Gammaproteobacteria bacterium]|nr:alanine--tRNA ligase [Gammaproteobacteria bacterium]
GQLTTLPKQCVDTGMGLERLAAVMQGVHNNYDIDLFQTLIKKTAELLDHRDLSSPSLKVIADHIRSAVFLIADGVVPSNEGRGYVIRRIIRRALRHGHKLQSSGPFFHQLVATVVEEMGDAYPLIQQTRKQIERVLLKEEEQFELTLDQGMRILNEAISGLSSGKEIPGQVVFKLYDTYGFPTDLTADIARERDLSIDMAGFDQEMDAQRERARAASHFDTVSTLKINLDFETEFTGYDTLEGDAKILALIEDGQQVDKVAVGDDVLIVLDRTPFYAESGGQVGDKGVVTAEDAEISIGGTIKSDAAWLHRGRVTKGEFTVGREVKATVSRSSRDAIRLNHSATHLLHAALRQVLGEHVNQRGSQVDAERLRFDFSHFEAVTKSQLRKIERLVNDEVRRNTVIQTEVMGIEAAREKGAMALFGEKYSEQVRVLTMGEGFSIELCGGTHASRTGDIGLFRVASEQGIASGVRRIEAYTGNKALAEVETVEDVLADTAILVKADRNNLAEKIQALVDQNKKLEKTVTDLNRKLATGGGQDLADSAIDLGELKLIVKLLDGADPKSLPDSLDQLKNKLGTGIVVLGTVNGGKVGLIAGVTKDLTDRFNAGDLVNHVATQVGGKGGGRADMARAGGSDPDALPAALESVEGFVRNLL